MRALSVLLLVALLAPAALAQTPAAPQSCGPLAMEAPTSPAEVAPGERGEVRLGLRNTHATNPMTVTLVSGIATANWRLVSDAQQTLSLAPGASGSFTVTVEATDAASQSAIVNLTVGGECTLAGGLPCPQGCAVADQSASAVIPLRQPDGFRIPGLDGVNLAPEYLVAGIVLVAVATAIPFLMRKRPGRFDADCPEPLKLLRPGRGTSFPIQVKNPTDDPLTAALEIGPVPEGWTAFMPLPEVQVAAKETRSLWLMVRAPPDAQTGAHADVEVRLRNVARPEVSTLVRVRAEVNPTASDSPAPT